MNNIPPLRSDEIQPWLDPDSLVDPWDVDDSNSEFKEGMSPREIAEIITNRLIKIVREDFARIKANVQADKSKEVNA
jgi:hypothetical protein